MRRQRRNFTLIRWKIHGSVYAVHDVTDGAFELRRERLEDVDPALFEAKMNLYRFLSWRGLTGCEAGVTYEDCRR